MLTSKLHDSFSSHYSFFLDKKKKQKKSRQTQSLRLFCQASATGPVCLFHYHCINKTFVQEFSETYSSQLLLERQLTLRPDQNRKIPWSQPFQ